MIKVKSNIKLELSDHERKNLRQQKIKKSDLLNYAADEISVLINISELRAREIYALADFQRIPSIGVEFAKDMIFLGFYKVADLSEKNGAELVDEYEKKKGYKTDPCVEDQFRLAVDFAKNEDYSKNWWDFTHERKMYREMFGYPTDRPEKSWTEVYNLKKK